MNKLYETRILHPGVRLLMHSANRLIKEDGELACVVGCAIGGQVWNNGMMLGHVFF